MRVSATSFIGVLRRFLRLRVLRWLLPVVVVTAVGGIAALGYWALPRLVPLPAQLQSPQPWTASLEVVDKNGLTLRRPLHNGVRRGEFVSLENIPACFVEATISAEDKRFWDHGGVDFLALCRVARDRIRHGRWTSGGSTITQQLSKICDPRLRTGKAKLIEILRARRLEMSWSKERILASYLNRIDYGNFHQGCVSAAEGYFGKPLVDCSPAECALLAGLPQSPSRLDPYRNPEAAIKRQKWIIERMRINGYLSDEEAGRAERERLVFAPRFAQFRAPHLVDVVLRKHGDAKPRGGELRTALDLELQQVCEQSLNGALEELRHHDAGQGAVVVLENSSGAVRALVGSRDYNTAHGQFNGATALRSPGSALKPFTYLLAMELGATPATVVADLPFHHVTPTGLYEPVNFDRRYYGPITYREALGNSLNVTATKVLRDIGGPAILQRSLKGIGITSLDEEPEHYGLGLTIGNAGVSLVDLCRAYACIARGGTVAPFRYLESPSDSGENHRVFSPENCYLLADMLSDPLARSRAFGLYNRLRFSFPVACKTGTSTDFRDAWVMAFTPEYTVGVWMGNFDGRPMNHVTGAHGPARAMRPIIEWLNRAYGLTWYERPANLTKAWIDPLNGLRIDPSLLPESRRREEFFRPGTLPPMAKPFDYDATNRTVLGPEYSRWIESPDNWARGIARVGSKKENDQPLIEWPRDGLEIYLDADLAEGNSRLPLVSTDSSPCRWESPTLTITSNASLGSYAELKPGTHTLFCRDDSGRSSQVTIRVN